MKILILSFYYQPDLSAGSFRCTALIEQLCLQGADIELVTTLPNRYASFSTDAPEHEVSDKLEVHRIALPSHNSGMLDQVKAFSTFYRRANQIVANKHYDIVFSTSSRLFTAFLGARIASKKHLPLYLDVRDIFVDTIKDVLSAKLAWVSKPIFSMIEGYTFKKAKRINLVSEGFRDYFSDYYPSIDYRFFTNGIDQEFIDHAPTDVGSDIGLSKVKVLYAGNIGEGQGLHTILPELAEQLGSRAEFIVVGDGGRKYQLQTAVQHLPNVTLLPPVKRDRLIELYKDADVLFLHLNDYPAFLKVLPSKIFEYAALGKPILAGVSGYSAKFLATEVSNSAVFNPGDTQQALVAFDALKFNVQPRTEFIEKYSRKTIMKKMASDIMGFCTDEQ